VEPSFEIHMELLLMFVCIIVSSALGLGRGLGIDN